MQEQIIRHAIITSLCAAQRDIVLSLVIERMDRIFSERKLKWTADLFLDMNLRDLRALIHSCGLYTV